MENYEFGEIEFQQTYNLRLKVLWPNNPEKVQLEEDALNTAFHFGLKNKINNEIIGVISLFLGEKSEDYVDCQFRKFAIDFNFQKLGFGKYMLGKISEFLINKFDCKIKLWCNARIEQEGFYNKSGFEEEWETKGIKFVKMKKLLNN
ncbi:hypothetical protein HK099_000452 [Clydaea vesicula]|uniref:N-acetyltransferase domain-containing protein n=1 Tax=Clydaea vesicula TaxID=447962 RepID=A0AAD5Y017_9FUNG|nr:hypothetical protein HK099_000452 [Clydaea vesicula]